MREASFVIFGHVSKPDQVATRAPVREASATRHRQDLDTARLNVADMDTNAPSGTRTGNTGSASLLSIRAAARASGKSERSLRRWIATGHLSAVDTPDGKRVDAAELLRLGLLRQAPEPAAPATRMEPAKDRGAAWCGGRYGTSRRSGFRYRKPA